MIDAHTEAAIVMVSLENCYVSAHTLIMAAEELIRNVYVIKGIDTDYDYRTYIKEEHHKDYLAKIREKYNFFKHADKDLDETLDIDEEEMRFLNELSLSLNIMAYRSIYKEIPHPMQVYMKWFAFCHKKYIKWEKVDMPQEIKDAASTASNARGEVKRTALRMQLVSADILPKIDIRYWLSKGSIL